MLIFKIQNRKSNSKHISCINISRKSLKIKREKSQKSIKENKNDKNFEKPKLNIVFICLYTLCFVIL